MCGEKSKNHKKKPKVLRKKKTKKKKHFRWKNKMITKKQGNNLQYKQFNSSNSD